MPSRIHITLIILMTPVLMAESCDEAGICERGAAFDLKFCFEAVAEATRDCYLGTGQACDSAALDPQLSFLRSGVENSCAGSRPQLTGYGSRMHGPTLAGRLEEECMGQVASLAAQAFGGPQASVLNAALSGGNTADETCLDAAFTEGARFVAAVFDENRLCAQSPELLDVPCDLPNTEAQIASARASASIAISAACSASDLESLIGIDLDEFLARARGRSDCMTSAGVADTWPLATTTCGPEIIGPSMAVPARGVPTQVVLDGGVWGSLCGDGSPYAFWVELAPAGSPVENVVFHMQGGGVCLFNDDCLSRSVSEPGLFNATGDGFPSGGVFDTDLADNPFANWTKVFLPYCTQDVFAGMGATEVFPSVTVQRYGASNVRAALQYVRNILWAEANVNSPEGYRPDRLTVLFGGSSAGGFGTLYNLHFPIDELRWVHTTGVADAALALDNGTLNGVIGIGFAKFPVWRSGETTPPYCGEPSCAAGPIIGAAHAERLLAVPDQQLLHLSNQVDNTQRNTTLFASTQDWTNAARASYCSEAGQDGLYYFLDANPQSLHTSLLSTSRLSTMEVGGVNARDWLGGAITDPGTLSDRVEEGTLTTAYPGVLPFSCSVEP